MPEIKIDPNSIELFDNIQDNIQFTPTPQNDVSSLESTLRGVGQGLTFDFADEALAGTKALFGSDYETELERERELFRQAREANPGAYLSGEVGGSILPAVGSAIATGLSGGTAAPTAAVAVPRTAMLLSRLAKSSPKIANFLKTQTALGAAEGGLQAYGASEEPLSESIDDIALGAGFGAALPGGIALTKTAGKNIRKPIEDLAGSYLGLSDEATDILRQNPDALNRIEKFEGLTNEQALGRVTSPVYEFAQKNPIKRKADEYFMQGMEALETSGKEFDISKLANTARKEANSFNIGGKGPVSDVDKAAQKKLLDWENRLKEYNIIPAKEAKQLLTQIRNDIDDWSTYGSTPNKSVESALKRIQRELSESIKNEVPEYRRAITKEARQRRLNEELIDRFATKGEIDPGKISSVISSAMNKPETTGKLKGEFIDTIGKRMRADAMVQGDKSLEPLTKLLENLKLKRQIEARANQGSNIVKSSSDTGKAVGIALGSGLGALAGGPVGAGIGAMLGGGIGGGVGSLIGKRAELRGRPALAKYFQGRAVPQITSNSKYAPILERAANQGSRSLAVTSYLLSQLDPEYRMTQQMEGEE